MTDCEGCKELICNMSFMLGYTSKSWTAEEKKKIWELIEKWDKKVQSKRECNCKCHDDGCNCALLHPELHDKKPDPCTHDYGVLRVGCMPWCNGKPDLSRAK